MKHIRQWILIILFILGGIVFNHLLPWQYFFYIPSAPEFNPAEFNFDLLFMGSTIGIFKFDDNEIDKGTYWGATGEFNWDWYGLQTVGIMYRNNTSDCAVMIEWSNGKRTCVVAPGWVEEY